MSSSPPRSSQKPSRRQLQKTISNMVVYIETVMNDINTVLGEVKDLMKQIDIVTDKIEAKYEKADKHNKNHTLDKNGNACGIQPAAPPQDDRMLIDMQQNSESFADEEVFGKIIFNFTYNDKYPLWIQCDSSKVKTSISDISIVSTGSVSDVYNEADDIGLSCKSVSYVANLNRNNQCNHVDGAHVERFSKCCVNKDPKHLDDDDRYCGVYETIMEEILEDSGEVIMWRDNDSSEDCWEISSDLDCKTSVSISDEHFISYKNKLTVLTSVT